MQRPSRHAELIDMQPLHSRVDGASKRDLSIYWQRSYVVDERLDQPPTLASTSALRKRSMNSMKPTEGTSRIRAVIEAIW